MMMMMMDRTFLRVFYLTGWFIFSLGLYNEYYFVNTPLNWTQAQNYCRTTYTDLATIENITEMNHVINTLSGSNSPVWTGLYVQNYWRWTYNIWDKFVDLQNQIKNGQILPYSFGYSFSFNGGRIFENYFMKRPFICANGTQEVYVNQSVDWFTAWRYCRENFTDLDSLPYVPWNASSWWYNAWVDNKNLNNLVPPDVQVWLGRVLYPQMSWSDGSNYSFSYWDNITYTYYPEWRDTLHGAVDLQRSGKWRLLPNYTTLPFVCYDRVDKKIFKLRLSSSVDLNDPDVNESILKQVKDRLKEQGVSGITLKWRKQADGKIFHKGEMNGGC